MWFVQNRVDESTSRAKISAWIGAANEILVSSEGNAGRFVILMTSGLTAHVQGISLVTAAKSGVMEAF